MQITIKNEEYNLKYSIKGLFYYESITNKPFAIESLTDSYVLFYAFILSSNPDKEPLQFDEFIEECDQNPTLIQQFNEFFHKAQETQELLTKKAEKSDKAKKKKA